MTEPVNVIDRQNAFELGFLKFAKDAGLDESQYAAFYNQGIQRFEKIAKKKAPEAPKAPEATAAGEVKPSEAAKKAPNSSKTIPVAAGKGCK